MALALARASHPGPGAAVTAFFAALGAGAGLDGVGLALLVGAAAAGQLSVGWANDWLDAGRDRSVGRPDKPLVAGGLSDALVRAAALTALALCVPLSLALGTVAGLAHLAAVAAAWAYDLGLKATRLSVVPYVVAFGLVPVVVAAAAGGSAPGWIVLSAALLGAGGHFANVAADLEEDARTDVHGLPHRLGRVGSLVAAALLLGSGLALVVVLGDLGGLARLVLGASGGLAAGSVLALGRRPHARGAFGAAIVAAAVAVAGVVTSASVLGP